MMWLSLLTNGMPFSRSFFLIRLAFSKISFLFLSRFSTIEILLEEATYNYNGMIIGIFELMQSGLEKSTAEIKATDALQNLFTAELSLNSVVLGRKLGAKSRTTEIASNKAKKGH